MCIQCCITFNRETLILWCSRRLDSGNSRRLTLGTVLRICEGVLLGFREGLVVLGFALGDFVVGEPPGIHGPTSCTGFGVGEYIMNDVEWDGNADGSLEGTLLGWPE
jgi:hypothetical protein